MLVEICEQYLPGYYSPGLVYQLTCVFNEIFNVFGMLFQHAFQIDALILKALMGRYIPNITKFMDVSTMQ